MKLILLNGSSCSGKSTVIEHVMREADIFKLSFDSIKWWFSKYYYKTHSDDVQKLLLSVAQTVFKMKYDVICDSVMDRDSRQKLIKLAKKYNYKILEVNLEADYKILSKRFDERVKNALSNPGSKRISNVSKERFKKIHDRFHEEKNPHAMTFRTDVHSADKISKKILKLL